MGYRNETSLEISLTDLVEGEQCIKIQTSCQKQEERLCHYKVVGGSHIEVSGAQTSFVNCVQEMVLVHLSKIRFHCQDSLGANNKEITSFDIV